MPYDLAAVAAALAHIPRARNRRLVIPDTETTGTDRSARIVEIGMIVIEPSGESREWRSLVDPELAIPPGASAVHKITDAMVTLGCRHCGLLAGDHPVAEGASPVWPEAPCAEWARTPTFAQLAKPLAAGFADADFAGKNVRFDLRVFMSEFARVGLPWSVPAGALVLCNDRAEQLGEPRDMSSLYRRRVGKEPPPNAHSALADVRMSAETLIAQAAAFPRLPWSDPQALHEMMWPGWIDSEGKFKFRDGVSVMTFGKYADVPMDRVPKSHWAWMLSAKEPFSPEVQGIVREAAAGRFPSKSAAPTTPADTAF